MCKRDNVWRIDKCMINRIKFLNWIPGLKTLGSCCGHDRYPMTIVVRFCKSPAFDIMSWTVIPRKRKFYRQDEDRYYYIPEVI